MGDKQHGAEPGVFVERFAGDATSVAHARDFVRRVLGSAEPGVVDDAELLTSELAANAVSYAGSDFVVRVRTGGGLTRVEVSDMSTTPPTVHHPDDDGDSGRGLWVVESIALSWGVDVRADGKSVWFVLET
jgi:anti-sigma regulatory factor (Ser/Thr protein kinase)